MRFLKEKKPIPKENPPKNLKTPTLSREKPELLPQKKQKTDTINNAKNQHFFENPKFLESIDKALEKSHIIIENDAKSEKKNEIKIKKAAINPKIVEIIDNDENQPGNKNNNENIQQNGDVQVIQNKIKKKVLIPTPLEKISEKKEIFIVSRNSEIKKIIIPPQEDLIIPPQKDLVIPPQEDLIIPPQKDLIIPPQQDLVMNIKGNEISESSLNKENPEKNKKSENLQTIENSQKKTELKNLKKENFKKKNSDSNINKENPDFTPNKLLERLKAGKNYKNELILEENSKQQEESSKKQAEIKKVDKTPKKTQIQDKKKQVENQDITIQELNIPGAFQEITAKKEKNPAKKTPKNPIETIPVDSVKNLDIKEAKQQRKLQRMMKKMERHFAGELSDVSPEKTSEDEKERKNLSEVTLGTKKRKK